MKISLDLHTFVWHKGYADTKLFVGSETTLYLQVEEKTRVWKIPNSPKAHEPQQRVSKIQTFPETVAKLSSN